jgi:hypothetical protein
MLPSGTAARLKNGSCKMMTISNALERQGPRNVFEIPPRAEKFALGRLHGRDDHAPLPHAYPAILKSSL